MSSIISTSSLSGARWRQCVNLVDARYVEDADVLTNVFFTLSDVADWSQYQTKTQLIRGVDTLVWERNIALLNTQLYDGSASPA